jgi:multiple sugar transport system substrate-binding protein
MSTQEEKKYEAQPPALISRRDVLKVSALTLAGATLAACTTATTQAPVATEPPAAEEPVVEEPVEEPIEEPVVEEPVEEPPAQPAASGTVTVMHFRHELTEDQEAQFEADHPDIQIEFVDGTELTTFFTMYAAGTPPDLVRVQAPSVPGMLARDLLLDLTPFFQVSEVLKPDDLMPANDYYKAISPLEIGTGNIYGMVKDFSPDFTIYAYKPLFEQFGISLPSDEEALTFNQIMELGKQLISFEGDRQLTIGYNYEQGWIDRIWMNHLLEVGKSLYTDNYEQIVLDDEDIVAMAQYFHDLGMEKVASSSVNPSPNGWFGTDFTAGILGLAQYGFWFSAMAESDVTRGQVMMLPGPTYAGVRRNPTMTATGMVATKVTKVPDASWLVFQWYNGEQPAIDRAMSGWGVPGLKSQLGLIPQESDFQKQANKVLQGELALETPPLQFNPYLGETVVSSSWSKYLDQVLRGEIDLPTALSSMASEVNSAIQDGITAIRG